MQHLVNVLTPATSQQLISLDELKTALRLQPTDSSHDAELILCIDGVSAEIANMANRVFGFEKVEETFFDVADTPRLYFSRWPVLRGDIEMLSVDDSDILAETYWAFEEATGMLYRPSGTWAGKIVARYSGGYKLPDEAPDDLKRAATVAGREDYYTILRGSTLSGVRMISHKSARVMYYPQGGASTSGTGGGRAGPSSGVTNAMKAVAEQYARSWV